MSDGGGNPDAEPGSQPRSDPMIPLVPTDWAAAADRVPTVQRVGGAIGPVSDLELVLWLLVCWTVVLDIGLTAYGLSVGLVERNPVIRHALDAVGLAALVAAKGVALAVAVVFRIVWPEYALVAPLGLAIPWVLVVVYNVTLLASL